MSTMIAVRAFGVLFGFALGASAWSAPILPPVSVTVSQTNVPNGTQYQYTISNKSKYPITSIVIGFNYFKPRPELLTPPLGWSVDGGLLPASVTAPSTWTPKITTTEDTDKLELSWTAASGSALAPGKSLQGFAVILPKADPSYKNAFWTVYVDGAAKNVFTGKLGEQAVCDVPRLSIALSPNILWPPNHKMIKIQAQISVQDDNFPDPIVTLDSITANETLSAADISAQFGRSTQTFYVKAERSGSDRGGRIYSITYSAKNSCGNVTSATETITVPHDQGR
jgi:hypothetical protein